MKPLRCVLLVFVLLLACSEHEDEANEGPPLNEEDPEVDPCDDVDCSGHGECIVEADEAVCECDPGYEASGMQCVPEGDPCAGVDCSGLGECLVEADEAVCECDPGSTADGLDCVLDQDPDPDPCESVDCSGHGECVVEDESPLCDCDEGYEAEGLSCLEEQPEDPLYGARMVPRSKDPEATDVFVSPTGSGDTCSEAEPCDLFTGISQGGFIWLMDGVYSTSEQVSLFDNNTLEALNRHQAIIDFEGSQDGRVTMGNDSVMRNFIVRGSGQTGVMVFGNNNLIEGMISEEHYYSGFAVWPSSGYDDLTNPVGGSFNIFRDTISRYNSENCEHAGGIPCDDSDADGFSISAGRGNQIIHCEAYNNADDGIDVWRSYESVVRGSIARGSGKNELGERIGNGNGFKMGSAIGPEPNNHRFVDNWSYDNEVSDFSLNGGDGFEEISGNVCGEVPTSCTP